MDSQRLFADAQTLERRERQLLVDRLQQELADEPVDDFTPEQRAEIDRRVAHAKARPEERIPGDQVMAEMYALAGRLSKTQ
jgi:putative addiction module component (TIGR02574 family)